jgi:aerobic carbon-monoxide dehydrogenase large subunit
MRHIGSSIPRPNALRLLEGRTRYVDDLRMARMAHVAFLRSPYAHCTIGNIELQDALASPGVIAAFTGEDLATVCGSWKSVLTHMEGSDSATQHPLAIKVARWQGEPLVAVVAQSRALAEDALQYINIDLEELLPLCDTASALKAEPLSDELEDNLCFERRIEKGDVDAAFAGAALVVEQRLSFGRQTGVPMEGRSVLATWSGADESFTIHLSHQAPHMMRDVVAKLFNMRDQDVRILCGDVGGSFGVKVHVYPDEIATIAIARLLKRPVKFVADRLESFASDIHAREHEIYARMGFDAQGSITVLEVHDTAAVGAYSMYPRTSAMEGNQVINFAGGPYRHANYRAWLQVVFQHKVPTSQYRAVGHPIACALAESLVDEGARRLHMDPVMLRMKNLIPDDGYPWVSPSGMRFERLSHEACLRRIVELSDYARLRERQQVALTEGRYLGIGIAMMIELTNPGPAVYSAGGAPISSQDGATLRLEPSGAVTVLVSVGEQGQGTETVMAQVAADAVGLDMSFVRVITGDTQATPMGGGTWGSRGAGIGGEAVWRAGRALRAQILEIAAEMLGAPADELEIFDGRVMQRVSHDTTITLSEIARQAYYRPDLLQRRPELVATRHFTPRDYPISFTNGVQLSLVEVDPRTGFVVLLGHWVVEDCGTLLNPLLADEQIRGGVVQGIGSALFEECLYDDNGQLLNATLADYLVPMAAEMPDIVVDHLCTPTCTSELGAKGVGEAGTCGAPAAILNAINDALAPLGASVNAFPITPERVLRAVGHIG